MGQIARIDIDTQKQILLLEPVPGKKPVDGSMLLGTHRNRCRQRLSDTHPDGCPHHAVDLENVPGMIEIDPYIHKGISPKPGNIKPNPPLGPGQVRYDRAELGIVLKVNAYIRSVKHKKS